MLGIFFNLIQTVRPDVPAPEVPSTGTTDEPGALSGRGRKRVDRDRRHARRKASRRARRQKLRSTRTALAQARRKLTAAHEGRIMRKRDNHARRFRDDRVRVLEVLPDRVIFADLQTRQEFSLSDCYLDAFYSTYELTPEDNPATISL